MTTEEKIDELKRQLAEIEAEVKVKDKPAKVMGWYKPGAGYGHRNISDDIPPKVNENDEQTAFDTAAEEAIAELYEDYCDR